MLLLRPFIRLFFLILGLVIGLSLALAAVIARLVISPPRQPLWASPEDFGLPYQNLEFPARDGLRLSGWFIPVKGREGRDRAATLVIVHGWPGNRLGTASEITLSGMPGSTPTRLLPLAEKLHQAGYQLLMFDLRNHGRSASARPVTFGLREANDLLGALDCLTGRPDVDPQRIGVIGFSAGANTLLYALPRTDSIAAAVAIQPVSPSVFSQRYAEHFLGPLGKLVLLLTELFYRAAGGLRWSAIDPIFAAAGAGNTPVLYVQGRGDPWGGAENVAQMAAATANAPEPLLVDAGGRGGAYQHMIEDPDILNAYFREHLGS
jgi:pimeloyl-ACP methyl ester carboxylesterase